MYPLLKSESVYQKLEVYQNCILEWMEGKNRIYDSELDVIVRSLLYRMLLLNLEVARLKVKVVYFRLNSGWDAIKLSI